MTKKNLIVLVVAFLTVIGFYLYLFRDYFRKPVIQISYTIRLNPAYLRRPPEGASAEEMPHLINFGLSGEFRLTSVKVVPVAELATNPFAHPVWEIISDSNSAPVRAFTYGYRIKGMHPAVKGATPDALQPNIAYRLFVESKSLKGQRDFTVTPEDHLSR